MAAYLAAKMFRLRGATRIHALPVAMLASAFMYFGAPSAATAALVTYELVGATAIFVNSSDTLTGSFTFDTTTEYLTELYITATGTFGFGTGTYTSAICKCDSVGID